MFSPQLSNFPVFPILQLFSTCGRYQFDGIKSGACFCHAISLIMHTAIVDTLQHDDQGLVVKPPLLKASGRPSMPLFLLHIRATPDNFHPALYYICSGTADCYPIMLTCALCSDRTKPLLTPFSLLGRSAPFHHRHPRHHHSHRTAVQDRRATACTTPLAWARYT